MRFGRGFRGRTIGSLGGATRLGPYSLAISGAQRVAHHIGFEVLRGGMTVACGRIHVEIYGPSGRIGCIKRIGVREGQQVTAVYDVSPPFHGPRDESGRLLQRPQNRGLYIRLGDHRADGDQVNGIGSIPELARKILVKHDGSHAVGDGDDRRALRNLFPDRFQSVIYSTGNLPVFEIFPRIRNEVIYNSALRAVWKLLGGCQEEIPGLRPETPANRAQRFRAEGQLARVFAVEQVGIPEESAIRFGEKVARPGFLQTFFNGPEPFIANDTGLPARLTTSMKEEQDWPGIFGQPPFRLGKRDHWNKEEGKERHHIGIITLRAAMGWLVDKTATQSEDPLPLSGRSCSWITRQQEVGVPGSI